MRLYGELFRVLFVYLALLNGPKMNRFSLFLALSAFVSPAFADDAVDLKARQLASAGVYISMCPTIEFGEGLAALVESACLTTDDVRPGGRYSEMMTRHAAVLKASTELAGSDPCERGLMLYGPKGFAFRNLIKLK